MRKRYEAAKALFPKLNLHPAVALRESLHIGYSKKDFSADLMAGVVVGIVALPLAMALAIASGVPPQHGIYTAIIGGGLIALLGGSRFQVSGPTAAFVVILAPISAQHGLGGLLLATMMAGVILFTMGAARLGRLIEFIPHPVTTGFTAGIAVVIATLQIDKLLGLSAKLPDHYIERVEALVHAAPSMRWPDLAIGAFTLAVLLAWPKVTRRVPAPLIALSLGAAAAALAHRFFGFEVATIASKFSYVSGGKTFAGIPPFPPLPSLPWSFPGPDGTPLVVSLAMLRTLLPSAFAIAVLGAIESLLCAVVADGMAGTKHDPDTELLAQGVGNIAAPFFGGIAATGAIARTATNIRAGARSPIAAVVHALFVLAGVVALAPLMGYLPMASLAALLLLVAWNMSEVKHFAHIVKVAPKSDVVVLLTCFSLTVVFDMVVSVSVGVMLAALLFMRRMAEISNARLVTSQGGAQKVELPPGVLYYEIAGPLFFGAAQKAIGALARVDNKNQVVVLDLESVPAMDVTGLVALESALAKIRKSGAMVVLAGVQKQPSQVLAKAGLTNTPNQLAVCATVEEALALVRQRVPTEPAASPTAGPLDSALPRSS
ncbi:MAG: C4-dicarboxylic acid transporter DauA [Myxococcota bacterium]